MISDTHVHTRYSSDSVEEPEAYVIRAMELGMKQICFADHYDMDFPDGRFVFDADEYFRELGLLREKYKGRLDIKIGIELGLEPKMNERLAELIRRYPFDLVIGSVHMVDGKDSFERDLFIMTDRELFRRYFEVCLECVKSCDCFDTLGHFDYIVRYGYNKDAEYSYPENADLTDEILKILIEKDIALEINTAGLKKGLAHIHPYPEILKRYRELGGSSITVGSDAHTAQDLGYFFKEITAYLKKFGFSKKDIKSFRQ